MPWWKNVKAGILGLHFGGDQSAPQSPQLVKPGEVFEADEAQIPKSYRDNGWIESVSAPAGSDKGPPPGSTQTTGPKPVQGSGTSMEQSTTDADAAASQAYEPASTPAERAALRDKDGESTADEKPKKHK